MKKISYIQMPARSKTALVFSPIPFRESMGDISFISFPRLLYRDHIIIDGLAAGVDLYVAAE